MKMRMRLGGVQRVGSLAGACGVLVTAMAAHAGLAQQAAKDAPAVAAAPAVAQVKAFEPVAFGALAPGLSQQVAKPVQAQEEKTAKPSKPGEQGIKVHGHWKIVIKNPDGTVDSTTEFENSLVTPGQGDVILTQLLLSYAVPSFWLIFVAGNLCGTMSSLSGCQIAPSTDTGGCSAPGCYANLITNYIPPTYAGSGSGAGFQLSGSFPATTTGSLVSVGTGMTLCSGGVDPVALTPSQCSTFTGVSAAAFYNFTGTTTPATVTSVGQIVQITVTISFS
jgi:hypothetical protein